MTVSEDSNLLLPDEQTPITLGDDAIDQILSAQEDSPKDPANPQKEAHQDEVGGGSGDDTLVDSVAGGVDVNEESKEAETNPHDSEEPKQADSDSNIQSELVRLEQDRALLEEQRRNIRHERHILDPYLQFAKEVREGDPAEALERLGIDVEDLLTRYATKGASSKPEPTVAQLPPDVKQQLETLSAWKAQQDSAAWDKEIDQALDASTHKDLFRHPLFQASYHKAVKGTMKVIKEQTGRVPSYSEVFNIMLPKYKEYHDRIANTFKRASDEPGSQEGRESKMAPRVNPPKTLSNDIAASPGKTSKPKSKVSIDMEQDDAIAAILEQLG